MEKETEHLLGVDVGNTKTVYALAKSDGTVIAKFRGPGANHQETGAAEMTRRLQEGVTAVTGAAGIELGDLAAIYYGAAGADSQKDFDIMRPAMAAVGEAPFDFENDCWIALYSGTLGGPGMAVTCGTGNTNCAANARGEKMRIGGLDENLGDVLGAHAIARYATNAAVRSDDGRSEPTILARMIPEALEVKETADLIAEELSSERVTTIVRTFFDAARKGDGKSLDICWMLVKEVLSIVEQFNNGLFKKERFRLVLEGSVFKQKYEPLMTMLELALKQKYEVDIFIPPWDPVVGALVMAFQTAGIALEKMIIERITQTYEHAEWIE